MRKDSKRRRRGGEIPVSGGSGLATGPLNEETLPIFILTHGRPDQVLTDSRLPEYGWSGPVYLVIDNEDPTGDQYRERFGRERVITFDKLAASRTFDAADNFPGRKTIVYARNASYAVARYLGYRYFVQFDDDYSGFYITINEEGQFKRSPCRSLDEVLAYYLDFFKSLPPTVKSIAMAQGGDFLGGSASATAKDLKLRRKAMNSFICDVERPLTFVGKINEDVNTYVYKQSKGEILLTAPLCQLNQGQTQARSGGMTDAYMEAGTYIKSFYSILFSPSCMSITDMGTSHRRLHHSIAWNNAVPRIVSPDLKKAS